MSVLVFDGDCGFCTSSARLAVTRSNSSAEIVAYQHADLPSLGLTPEACASAVQYIDRGGQVHNGAAAIARFMLESGALWRPFGALLLLPGIRRIAQFVYEVTARNRHRLPVGTPACAQHQHD